jgi:hypothetical protein
LGFVGGDTPTLQPFIRSTTSSLGWLFQKMGDNLFLNFCFRQRS